MTFIFFRKIFITMAAALLMFVCADGYSQGMNLFGGGGKTQKRSGSSSTVITSDSMNIDMANNMAVFTGNVYVDDEQMAIKCQKMVIYLEDKSSGGKNASFSNGEGYRDIKKIICTGDVVIIRKVYDASEKAKGEQKAYAGKAEYNVKTGKIVLTENKPSINRGKDRLIAEKIIIYRDNDKVETEGRSRIELTPQPSTDKAQNNGGAKPETQNSGKDKNTNGKI